MFGQPVTQIAERLGKTREVDRVLKRVCRGEAGRHRRLVNDGKLYWMPSVGDFTLILPPGPESALDGRNRKEHDDPAPRREAVTRGRIGED